MLTWRFAGFAISRVKCCEMGLTDRRWEWARALLMASRIHDGSDITEPDFRVALQRLAATHDRIEATGDIGSLIMRRRRREPMTATKAAPKPEPMVAPKAAQPATG